MVEVSIIIPSWNAKQYLQNCIESIVKETQANHVEIIVVDNASTDGSKELVQQQFPQVKLICNRANLGFAKASNIGIKQGSGRYFCIVNSDVEVLDGCFNRMIEYMEQNPEIGMLGPQILDANNNIQRSTMGFPTVWNTLCRALALDTIFPGSKLFGGYLMTFWSHDTLRKVDVINGCLWLVRREALNQVGMLDERFFIYAEDKDWCKRFWNAGWNVVYFPHARAIHYGGASSSQAPIRFYIEMHRANLQYWKKHHKRLAQIVFLLVTGLHNFVRLLGETLLYIVRPEKRKNTVFKIRRSIASLQWLFGFDLRGNHNES